MPLNKETKPNQKKIQDNFLVPLIENYLGDYDIIFQEDNVYHSHDMAMCETYIRRSLR